MRHYYLHLLFVFLITFIFSFYSCSPSPEPIEYGSDNCSHCKMTIVERNHGAEMVTSKGRIYKFDSIECMAAYTLKNKVGKEEIHALLVTDFDNPGVFIDATSATFLHSPRLRSPMGLNLTAMQNREAGISKVDKYGGNLLDWVEILALVNDEWLQRGK